MLSVVGVIWKKNLAIIMTVLITCESCFHLRTVRKSR